ncbi:MAG: SpoIID/LytB domain-containing protein [Bdellovibrio sp.]|nr:SpoIID/LytB domain-containing protein [Bdellovibrio sp.]
MIPFLALSSLAIAAEVPNPVSQGHEDPFIRVRVIEQADSVLVRGYDVRAFSWSPPKTDLEKPKQAVSASPTPSLLVSLDRTSQWEIHCKPGEVTLQPKGKSHGVHVSKVIFARSPVSLQAQGGFITLGNIPYRDSLFVYSKGKSGCEVVNLVSLEKYLDGLVNSEFSSKWNDESISAQVVAARTYAYFQMLDARTRGSHFDLDATTRDQVYNGSMKEDFRASAVVQKSRGMVLSVADAPEAIKPIKAFYHSTCGGHTELPEHVWGVKYSGVSQATSCAYCQSSPRYQWDLDAKKSEIQSELLKGALDYLRKGLQLPKEWPGMWEEALRQGTLLDLRLGALDPENRVSKITVVISSGRELFELPMRSALFREWMGPTRFRSTAFDVYTNSNGTVYHFSGRGNGHGVGMCQWGAKVMGEKGKKTAEILKLYYPGAFLRRAW